ncbi:hypothetical protein TcWFU_005070 [Taenia crassiceps]|uniref:RING-type domain-containing protein n=1 Tax=Taenia crassiceps TaxID=6207 RepID=A0ABR4Q494_9CEST
MQSASIAQGKESAEKTARSIFVGNIPYEATEEKLVELFSKAGPVVSFRLVYDRESGKPKGYGFCEYANPAIAASALRNLQNIEFNGRPLRIGAAAGEQNSAEIALTNPSVGPPLENPYGNPVDPAKAPEAISRAVASLPPEQMYELMKQMKFCIQNNPNEARSMLLQNPQLAYALLQAQVVMKIVDPKVAIAMLNRTHDQIPPLVPENVAPPMCKAPESGVGGGGDVTKPFPGLPMNGTQFPNQPPAFPGEFPPEQKPSAMGGPGIYGSFQPPPPPPPQQPQPHQVPGFPHLPHPSSSGPLGQPSAFSVGAPQPGVPPPATTVHAPSGIPSLDQLNPAISAALMAGTGGSVTGLPQKEQEKLDLIMQVLSLSEESIALLPEDEQRSIRILKEQHRCCEFTGYCSCALAAYKWAFISRCVQYSPYHSMSYSRRFAFFDKVEPNIEKNERGFQDLPVTCASSGGGYLWLGDVDGFMHCLDTTFTLASFRAHNAGPVRLCRQVPGVESHLLVTVGISSDDSTSGTRKEERVCVWNTKKWSLTSKTSFPVCCRSVRTTATTAATASANLDEVVCLEVASTMDVILLGHTSGAVQLIKGDITSDRQCRRLILHEFASSVTDLHYVAAPPTSTNMKRHKGRHAPEQIMPESDSGSVSSTSPLITKPTPSSAYVYAASENKLVSIKLGKKDEPVRTTVLDTFGCRRNCSCLVADPEKPDQKILAMAHKEAVYFYDPDGRGPCLAIVGNKKTIAVYKNYLVYIRSNKPGANQVDFPEAQSLVSLFEYRNKFVGGEFVLPGAQSIITGFGGLFVLCVEEGSKVKIVELVEKDTQSMLDILFARKSFSLALGIAESDKYSEEELAHIHRRYADHLFNQKQYDLAVKEYIQTIGTIEASYVVLRFLESGLITHLVRYLEALVESDNMGHGRLTKDHTALLLNSYARLDDKERIDAFLDRLASLPKVGSEFYSCINVLRRANYPHQALRLAEITGNHADCIRILTEDLKDAEAALKAINSLPFDQALEVVCTHGAFLMQNAPSETAELLDRLCSNPSSGRISASQFIKIFVNNRLGLMKFLERYIEKSTSTDACLTDVIETLLELLLYEINEVAADETAKDRDAKLTHLRGFIMRLLEDPKATYDEGKALILCKQRNFLPGCLYIWMKNKQYDQIMEHYILEDNFEAILKACEEYGDEVPSLWFEAFKYAADKPQLGEHLPRLLSEIESRNLAPPLVVLQLLTSPDVGKCHTLGSVKAYFLHYLESGKEKVEANEAQMQRLREETLRNREIARQSKTRVKIFQQQKCAICNQPLEPPSIHFLCDHSYHKSCFDTYSSDDQLCLECAPRIRRDLMEAGKTTSQLPTLGSAELLAELERSLNLEKADLSNTLSKAIAKGIASKPSSGGATKLPPQPPKSLSSNPSLPRMPSGTVSKTPFDDLPPSRAATLGDSGRGDSLPSGLKPPSIPSTDSATDFGVVLPTKKVSKGVLNPFGEDDDDGEAEDAGGKNADKVTDAPTAVTSGNLGNWAEKLTANHCHDSAAFETQSEEVNSSYLSGLSTALS